MNQETTIYTSDQKPNSRSSSIMNETESDINKRRRLVESNGQTTPTNNMFRPNITQSILIQQQLSNIFGNSSNPSSNNNNTNVNGVSPNMSRSQSLTVSNSNSPKSESPTPSLTNLHIEETREKSRHELFQEQMRLREEFKKRQMENYLQAKELEKVKRQEQRNMIIEQEELRRKAELEKQKEAEKMKNDKEKAQVDSDDDVMVDEEMTNKNVCMGMIKTDIVVEKSPLILTRDDQYEIVSLESEGKLNNENYSFKVTSRSQPPRFYGWIPFQDTKVMGPLVDHRLIWWDAVIPRGKATNTRTPICIILYCRPDLLGTIAKYFQTQRVILKTPPFYNPACRYSNPHHQILEQQYNYQQYQQRQLQQQTQVQQPQQQIQSQQQVQQQQNHQQPQPHHGYGGGNYQGYSSNYSSYQYDSRNPYYANNYRSSYGYQQPLMTRDAGQEQKDIEMLLSSIPSDVPLLSKKKKKRAMRKNKKHLDSNIIEIKDDDEEEDENMSEAEEDDEEDDPGHVEGLTCHLMEHQIQGVSWMIDRENNESSNGGILADMGLGKTIQTIALMASTMTSEESDDTEETKEDDNHRITLIVTPVALLNQWVDEIISKTEKDKLRVLKHHGANRTKNPAVFHRYDVVVTSYQVVASDMPSANDKKKKKKHKRKNSMDDFLVKENGEDEEDETDRSAYFEKYKPLKKDHGPLFQVNWYRVVLDEAQHIKNRTTKSSTSCAELSSSKRWCLTGTPIQNNVDELYSFLRFLRIQPLSEYATFKKNISIPIMNGDTRLAMSRLKAVLMAVMLRRTKSVLNNNNEEEVSEEKEEGESEPSSPSSSNNEENNNNGSLSKKLALKLPSRQKTDVLLTFSQHERAFYDNLMTQSKRSIQLMGKATGYMNMLCMLLRLRQACDHPQLILNSIDNDKDVLDIVSDVPNSDQWSSSQHEVCELCGRSNSENKDKTPYCNDCINMLKTKENQDLYKTSTKMRKLIEILKETHETNPGEKTIIFSQFTTMMDLMEGPLRQNGFKFCRYDGSMSTQLREKSLTTLKYDPKCTVMLISLKCGSLGLNLTSANRVILVDPWWNPALEEQAIDRVHRIGQRLPVHVTRLIIENTVELKMIQLQEKKAQLSKGALGDGLVKSAKLTTSEIRSLFSL